MALRPPIHVFFFVYVSVNIQFYQQAKVLLSRTLDPRHQIDAFNENRKWIELYTKCSRQHVISIYILLMVVTTNGCDDYKKPLISCLIYKFIMKIMIRRHKTDHNYEATCNGRCL